MSTFQTPTSSALSPGASQSTVSSARGRVGVCVGHKHNPNTCQNMPALCTRCILYIRIQWRGSGFGVNNTIFTHTLTRSRDFINKLSVKTQLLALCVGCVVRCAPLNSHTHSHFNKNTSRCSVSSIKVCTWSPYICNNVFFLYFGRLRIHFGRVRACVVFVVSIVHLCVRPICNARGFRVLRDGIICWWNHHILSQSRAYVYRTRSRARFFTQSLCAHKQSCSISLRVPRCCERPGVSSWANLKGICVMCAMRVAPHAMHVPQDSISCLEL